MATNIIAYGGTFNPLTNAHVMLIQKALEVVEDSEVVVIPSPTHFMRSWKKMKDESIYDDTFRVELLRKVVEPMDHVVVSTMEIDGLTTRTYDTLNELQSKYPGCTIWWMCGDEKCDELLSWYQGEALVKNYHFLMFTRISDDAETYFNQHEALIPYRNNWRFIPLIPQIQSISSTKVRHAINHHAWRYVESVCPKVVVDALKMKGVNP